MKVHSSVSNYIIWHNHQPRSIFETYFYRPNVTIVDEYTSASRVNSDYTRMGARRLSFYNENMKRYKVPISPYAPIPSIKKVDHLPTSLNSEQVKIVEDFSKTTLNNIIRSINVDEIITKRDMYIRRCMDGIDLYYF